MKKTLKIFGYLLVSLVFAFVLAVAFVNIYRAELLEAVNEKLKEEINGDIHIGKLGFTLFHDFPNVSLSLRDSYMRGPQHAQFHRDFLQAEIIDINVEALKLFRREISIKSIDIINGEVFIFKSKSGYSNLDIFKRSKPRDTTAQRQFQEVSFKNINLRNVTASFHDSLMRKEFGVRFINVSNTITPFDSIIKCHITGDLHFIGLMFNAEKGSFLKNKSGVVDFNLEILPAAKQLVITPSTLTLTKSRLHLSGLFQFANPRSFHLAIQSDSMDYKEGVSVLTESLTSKLGKISIEKTLAVHVIVGGPLIPGRKAEVDMTFLVNDCHASVDKIDLEHLTVKGSLINHVDKTKVNDEENTSVTLDTLQGKFKGLDFSAHAFIRNLKDPTVDVKARFDFQLKELNSDTLPVRFFEGRVMSTISYQGRPREYQDHKKGKYAGKLEGEVMLSSGKMEYPDRQMMFDNVDAQVKFTNEVLQLERIAFTVNNSPLIIKGSLTGVLLVMKDAKQKINAALTVTSPKLDFAQIFLKKKIAKTRENKSKPAKNKKTLTNPIDDVYKKLEADITFHVRQFVNKKFKGEDLDGKIILADDQLLLNDVRMKIARGQVNFSANLKNLQKNVSPFVLNANVRNAEIKDLFYAFNNFGQTTIRDAHLSGKVNVDARLKGTLNNELALVKPSLRGDVSFQLRKGRLRNFDPLQKMSNFLLKGRDLSDVRFGEINSQFTAQGTEFNVSRMEVQSTALTLYVEGLYSLADNTDISIQVPLSNLKSRRQDIPPENIGSDKRVGASVFLRARKGKDGTTEISYDPFRKALKTKKGSKKK